MIQMHIGNIRPATVKLEQSQIHFRKIMMLLVSTVLHLIILCTTELQRLRPYGVLHQSHQSDRTRVLKEMLSCTKNHLCLGKKEKLSSVENRLCLSEQLPNHRSTMSLLEWQMLWVLRLHPRMLQHSRSLQILLVSLQNLLRRYQVLSCLQKSSNVLRVILHLESA